MKRYVKLILAALLYYSGVERVLRFLLPRRDVAIFMLHSVQDQNTLTRAANFSMDVQTFERRMRFLRRYSCVRMADVADAISGQIVLPADAVSITFDDGYADNYEIAFPILKKYSLPATVYLTTDYIDANRWLPLNQLYDAILRTCRTRLVVPAGLCESETSPETLPLRNETEKLAAITYLRQGLKSLSTQHFERYVATISDDLLRDVSCQRGHEFDMLTWAQIATMSDLVEFGSHTASHTILSRADHARQTIEIERSTNMIKERTRANVIHFAFPNGHRDDYNNWSIHLLRQYGYQTAVTTEVGVNEQLTTPFELRRMGLDRPNCIIALELLGLTTWLRSWIAKRGSSAISGVET